MKVTMRLPSDSKAFAGIYDLQAPDRDSIDFVNNEKGLAAIVGATKQGADVVHMNLELSRNEVATIWYALAEYKEKVKRDLEDEYADTNDGEGPLTPFGPEDEMFLGETIAKLARLQYQMHDDHEPPAKAAFIRDWMDV